MFREGASSMGTGRIAFLGDNTADPGICNERALGGTTHFALRTYDLILHRRCREFFDKLEEGDNELVLLFDKYLSCYVGK